jgi:hypothetical protein
MFFLVLIEISFKVLWDGTVAAIPPDGRRSAPVELRIVARNFEVPLLPI